MEHISVIFCYWNQCCARCVSDRLPPLQTQVEQECLLQWITQKSEQYMRAAFYNKLQSMCPVHLRGDLLMQYVRGEAAYLLAAQQCICTWPWLALCQASSPAFVLSYSQTCDLLLVVYLTLDFRPIVLTLFHNCQLLNCGLGSGTSSVTESHMR